MKGKMRPSESPSSQNAIKGLFTQGKVFITVALGCKDIIMWAMGERERELQEGEEWKR